MNSRTLYLIPLLLLWVCAHCQSRSNRADPIHLDIKNRNVSMDNDLTLHIRIRSIWHHAIAVPRIFTEAVQMPMPDFIIVQVQKLDNGAYKKYPHQSNIEVVPSEVDSLNIGDSRKDDLDIYPYFVWSKGRYRARVLCQLSLFNPGFRDRYSHWVYFKCLRDIKRIRR